MQRLGVPLGGGHGLQAGADDVVVDVLRGQRPARGLRVGAQRQRLVVLRAGLLDQLRPQQPAGPELGDLHEEVHADAPEEAQPRRERVDVHPGGLAGLEVLHAVGQRVGQLQVGRRPGLLDVVAGDRDRVEPRHLLRGEREDVADDLHRGLGRIDVGVAHHELFEDVVLDGPGQLLRLHPLLLGRDDVERQHRQHGAVHRHRDAHLVQRDAVEELPHVEDRVDRHARHADVADHARVVGVVAAVGGQVEGDATGPSARRRGCAGRTRWTPPRWRSRRTAGSSTAGSCTSSGRARAGRAGCPGRCRGSPAPRGRPAVNSGGTAMPSGVSHVASSTLRPVVSSNALAQLVAPRPRRTPGGPARRRRSRGSSLMPVLPAARARCGARRARRTRRRRTRRRRRPPGRACRPARPCVAPASRSSFGQPGRRLGVVLVGAADAGDRRPRLGEALGAVAGRRLEAAGLEQVAGERRPRGVPGDRADRGEVDPRRGRGVGARRAAPRTPARPAPAAARRWAASGGGLALGQLLGQVRELADAGDRVGAVWPAASTRSSQAAAIRSRTRPESSAAARPPARSISVNQSQAALGERVGQRLDVPGAAGRVEHAGQVPLLDQQALGVAGDPAGEGVGQPERGVERLHGDDVGAAHARGEAGDRRAQQVHPRVALRRHHRRGDGVLPLAAHVRRGAADLADPVPQPARGAQRGDRRELVGGRARSGTRAGRTPRRRVRPPSVSARR